MIWILALTIIGIILDSLFVDASYQYLVPWKSKEVAIIGTVIIVCCVLIGCGFVEAYL